MKQLCFYETCRQRKYTCNSSIKVWVGGHFEAWVRHQETGDVGEARVDVFTHVLQLFMLVLRDLQNRHGHMSQTAVHSFGSS